MTWNDGEHEDGEVVYRRAPNEDHSKSGEEKKTSRKAADERLAPTLRPLIVGFALLLGLVVALGFLSVARLGATLRNVSDPRDQLVGSMRRLLQIQSATTTLSNEARARMRSIPGSGDEVKPLFNLPLDNARKDVSTQLAALDRLPLSEMPEWHSLRNHIQEFLDSTNDPTSYSLNGFRTFRDVNEDLEKIQIELETQRRTVIDNGVDLQKQASRTIYLLTMAAFVVGVLVVAFSIAEVQRRFRQTQSSMDAARRERQFSTQMIEGMVSAVAALDSRDRIRSANSAFLNLFPNATVGSSVHDKSSNVDAGGILEIASSRRVSRATYFGRWPIGTGGATRSFDLYISPVEIDKERGQVITLVDVTEVGEAETALRRSEALAAVGQAAAQLAHEIKNPLGSIRLGVAMLRDSARDDESVTTINLVERGITHLNNLVVDVTQFSREKVLELKPVDLSILIESSLELVIDKIQAKNSVIRKSYFDRRIMSLWDEDQLRQVFVNLIGNALDASSEGATVEISTQIIRESNSARGASSAEGITQAVDIARIRISDQGSGMTPETLSRIFEPFFTTKKRGTGLGLAVVKKVVESHRGTISATSEPGQGTTFTVDLPVQPVVSHAEKPQVNEAA